MKLIFCDKCRRVIQLVEHERRECICGRIGGQYSPGGLSAAIWIKSKWPRRLFRGARVLAIDTNLILGRVKQSTDYVFDLWKSGLTVYYNGELIRETPKDYAIKNAIVFLGNSIACMRGVKNAPIEREMRKIFKKLKAIHKKTPK